MTHKIQTNDASELPFKRGDHIEYLRQVRPEVWVQAEVMAVYTYENLGKFNYGVKSIKSDVRTEHVAAHVRK